MADDAGVPSSIGVDDFGAISQSLGYETPAASASSDSDAGSSTPAAKEGDAPAAEVKAEPVAVKEAAKPAPAAAVKPVPPKQAAAPAAKVEEKKVEPAKVEEKKPEPVAAAPAPAAAPVAQPTQEQQAAAMKQYEDKLVEGMTNHFAAMLDAKDAELLATEPEKALPRILAKTGMSLYYATYHAVAQAIPGMIQAVTGMQESSQKAEQTLFDSFKELQPANAEHRAAIGKVAQAYHLMNPNVQDKQKAIQEIGRMTVAMLGLAAAPAPASSTVQPPAPVQAASLPPHRPAIPGTGGPSNGAPSGAWSDMVKEFEAI